MPGAAWVVGEFLDGSFGGRAPLWWCCADAHARVPRPAAFIVGVFFVADKVVDNGQRNLPAGWGNPYQRGTLMVAGSEAVFHDDDGHTVIFHERPGATGFLRTCS